MTRSLKSEIRSLCSGTHTLWTTGKDGIYWLIQKQMLDGLWNTPSYLRVAYTAVSASRLQIAQAVRESIL